MLMIKNILNNLKNALFFFIPVAAAAMAYSLIKLQIDYRYFSSGRAELFSLPIYIFALKHLFSIAIALGPFTLMFLGTRRKLRGGVAILISIFIIAMASSVYPTYMRHFGIPRFENVSGISFSTGAKPLKSGAFHAYENADKRMTLKLEQSSKHHLDYKDIILIEEKAGKDESPAITLAESASHRNRENALVMEDCSRYSLDGDGGAFIKRVKTRVPRQEDSFLLTDLIFTHRFENVSETMFNKVSREMNPGIFFAILTFIMFVIMLGFYNTGAAFSVEKLKYSSAVLILLLHTAFQGGIIFVAENSAVKAMIKETAPQTPILIKLAVIIGAGAVIMNIAAVITAKFIKLEEHYKPSSQELDEDSVVFDMEEEIEL